MTVKTPSKAQLYAQVENISIMCAKERLGPLALWVYARSYLHAARMLPADRDTGVHIPRAFLICHAVELALKSFLAVAKSYTLKTFVQAKGGHNLEHWLGDAKAAGLANHVTLTRDQEMAIREWSDGHRGKLLAYPAIGQAMLGLYDDASLDMLETAASALIVGLHGYCHQPLPPLLDDQPTTERVQSWGG
ncbi:MAG: hypothetical protein IPP21_18150 [Betaproteobacteria bacterium]|nr:hypothetical protein [Betaproteobacteria bacterium]